MRERKVAEQLSHADGDSGPRVPCPAPDGWCSAPDERRTAPRRCVLSQGPVAEGGRLSPDRGLCGHRAGSVWAVGSRCRPGAPPDVVAAVLEESRCRGGKTGNRGEKRHAAGQVSWPGQDRHGAEDKGEEQEGLVAGRWQTWATRPDEAVAADDPGDTGGFELWGKKPAEGGQLQHRDEFLHASKGSPCSGQPRGLAGCRQWGAGGRKEHEPAGTEHFAHGAGKWWGCGPASLRSGHEPADALCPQPRGWALSTGAGGPLAAGQTVPRTCHGKAQKPFTPESGALAHRPTASRTVDVPRLSCQRRTPVPHAPYTPWLTDVLGGIPPARVCSVVTIFPSCQWGGSSVPHGQRGPACLPQLPPQPQSW